MCCERTCAQCFGSRGLPAVVKTATRIKGLHSRGLCISLPIRSSTDLADFYRKSLHNLSCRVTSRIKTMSISRVLWPERHWYIRRFAYEYIHVYNYYYLLHFQDIIAQCTLYIMSATILDFDCHCSSSRPFRWPYLTHSASASHRFTKGEKSSSHAHCRFVTQSVIEASSLEARYFSVVTDAISRGTQLVNFYLAC